MLTFYDLEVGDKGVLAVPHLSPMSLIWTVKNLCKSLNTDLSPCCIADKRGKPARMSL